MLMALNYFLIDIFWAKLNLKTLKQQYKEKFKDF
jgi:hypothetical protein